MQMRFLRITYALVKVPYLNSVRRRTSFYRRFVVNIRIYRNLDARTDDTRNLPEEKNFAG